MTNKLNIVVTALLWSGLSLAVWIALKPSSVESAKPTLATAEAQPAADYSVDEILALNVMGNKQKTAEKPKQTEITNTRLKLSLSGVFTSNLEGKGSALITGTDKKSKMYKVGDNLPGGAMLSQVNVDSVLLNRAGKLEKLMLKQKTSDVVTAQPQQVAKAFSLPSSKPETLSATLNASHESRSLKQRLEALKTRNL